LADKGILAGVHIPSDREDGLTAGFFIGQAVWNKVQAMWGSKVVLPQASGSAKNFTQHKPKSLLEDPSESKESRSRGETDL
jgi:hypothetical protein